MTKIELVARIICKDRGDDPDYLEPGFAEDPDELPCGQEPDIDGVCRNGDPGYYLWRDYISVAKEIIAALQLHG